MSPTKSQPEEDTAGLLGPAPTDEIALERVSQILVRILAGVLAARLGKRADGGGEGKDQRPESAVDLKDEDRARDLEEDRRRAKAVPPVETKGQKEVQRGSVGKGKRGDSLVVD